MPLYLWKCQACAGEHEGYVHHPDDKGCVTHVCACGATMAPVLSMGRGLLWFEEGRARVIHNMGRKPVVVRSHAEHQRLMKSRKLALAGTKPGMRGQWL